jgi:hemerythrin-like domain-containing protein
MNSSTIPAISAIPVENINHISHIALPGHHSPGVGFEEPFEMLEACHERSLRMLWLLERVQTHLSQKGWDTEVAQAAADVIRYFDQAAPRHHEDEERHLFSRLLASAAHQHLHELVARLQQEHHDMNTVWAQARPILWRVAHWGDDGQPNPSAHWQALGPQEIALLKQFGKLYDDHIPDEDNMIYPAAKHLLDPAALRAMSEDMMQRRGLPVGSSE